MLALAGSLPASPVKNAPNRYPPKIETKPLRGGNASQVNGLAPKVASPLKYSQVRRPLRRALSTGTTPDHVRASSVLDDRPESGVRKPTERFASKPTRDSDGRKSIDEGHGRKFSPVRFLDSGYPKNKTAMAWPSSSPTELVQLGHHPTQHGVESGRFLSGGITLRKVATSPRQQAPSPFLFPRQSLAN
jgi:hypothetical protein